MFKKIKKLTTFSLSYLGFYPSQLIDNFKGLIWYFQDYRSFSKKMKDSGENWKISPYPILNEKNKESGTWKGHYFLQDLYVAQKIYQNQPYKHVDIGSRIDGFIAHVATFREIEVLDIRPLEMNISNVSFKQVDLMRNNSLVDYCDSLSCLHTIEHFGLGRYGDTIDPNGHISGIKNMAKILKSGGIFYFSTQIGKQRIEFNAHRVFDISYLISILKNDFEIIDFAYVDNDNNLIENINLNNADYSNNFGCKLGCGIFTLKKR